MAKDWIPSKELDRIEFLKTWKTGLANPVYKTQFGWKNDDCAALIDLIDQALSAFASYETDKTEARRITKDRTMKAALAACRDFANSDIRYNKLMAPEYRLVFYVHERDSDPTPGGEPRTKANITGLKPLGSGAIEIRFQDETTPHSWAIPEAYNGCLLAFSWGPEKVTEYAQLTQTALMTHHIWRLELPPEAAGNWLSLAVRWQSHTGEKGLWSAVQHIAVS